MKKIGPLRFLFACLIMLYSPCIYAQDEDKMSNVKMWRILKEDVGELKGEMGSWKFMYRERPVMIITDPGANRMRIMSPVIEEIQIKDEQYKLMLEANFDRALDAKYSIYNNVVWSVFTHPLEELSTEQFKDAIDQVVRLSETFGGSYTSTDFVFGG